MPESRAADAVSWYEDLLAGKHFTSTRDELDSAIQRHRLYWKNRPLCSVLRPHIVDTATLRDVQRAATLVTRAIVDVSERVLADPTLAKVAGVPTYLEPTLAIDRAHGSPSLLARLDGLIDGTGNIKFIEHNSEPGCISDEEVLDAAFSTMPIAREFAQRFPFKIEHTADAFVEALVADFQKRGGRGAPTIAVIRKTAEISQHRAFQWLVHGTSRGCRFLLAMPDEFRIRGAELFVEDERVDLVHVDWDRILAEPDTIRPIVDALARGVVRPLFGLSRNLICDAKSLFELLSDPSHAHLFDRESAAALAVHIPWTRRVRECKTTIGGKAVDLVPYVAQHRDGLVLKPSGGFGAEGITLGWECDDDRWQRALKVALSRPYVVQERVVTRAQRFPALVDDALAMVDRFVDFNPYILNGEGTRGHLARTSTTGVLNMATGGGSTARWIID